MTAVVGLDLSLTGSGLARIAWSSQARVVDTRRIGLAGITTMSDPTDRARALHGLKTGIVEWAYPADLVVVESMVPNPVSRSTNERGALWYLVVLALLNRQVRVEYVHPGTLKRYGAGTGDAGKPAMRAAAREAFPDVVTSSPDEDDALWLAGIGVHMLGGPLPYPVTPQRTDVVRRLKAASSAA